MSSIAIYPHVPYFYIIQHTPSGKYYAGCRFGKTPTKFSKNGCHPEELLNQFGYVTSSTPVKNLIVSDGLESFKVILTIPETECMMSVYDYETVFLQSFEICEKDNWLNKHNNHFDILCGDSFKNYFMQNYGVEHPSQLQSVKDIRKANNMERYGFENNFQVEKYKQKSIITCNEKYGKDYFAESDIGKETLKLVINQKYGVDNVFQLTEIKDKIKLLNLERYGVAYPMQNREIIEKRERDYFEKYGVNSFSQTKEGREMTGNRFKGSFYYNNGITNVRLRPEVSPPDGFIRGRLVRKKETIMSVVDCFNGV